MLWYIGTQGHRVTVSDAGRHIWANTAWDGTSRPQATLPAAFRAITPDGTDEPMVESPDFCCLQAAHAHSGLPLGYYGEPGYLVAGGVITLWPATPTPQVCAACEDRINRFYDEHGAAPDDPMRRMALKGMWCTFSAGAE